jgi:hypothetical protein
VGNDTLSEIAERLALDALDDSERASAVVYLDSEPRPPGTVELPGPGAVPVHTSGPSLIAFVDRRPGANWMHDARYLLIEPHAGAVCSFPAEGPPTYGPLPPGWRVVWHPASVESWRILPLASTVDPQPRPTLQEPLEAPSTKEEPS